MNLLDTFLPRLGCLLQRRLVLFVLLVVQLVVGAVGTAKSDQFLYKLYQKVDKI